MFTPKSKLIDLALATGGSNLELGELPKASHKNHASSPYRSLLKSLQTQTQHNQVQIPTQNHIQTQVLLLVSLRNNINQPLL